ncbi:alpha-glucosidase, putative [Paecilomyces variotii No. 5]|uniref:Probable alpha/beta-glucosidase agdC n=1 Tax=Byssochlamys spectabilis (strain No. 5 / NBRC 109023) TaxID=1356009 RepID=V5GE33_BYSSN|nr:alpha-glucosidase, putative [Paecilomyces variotii No. 5]
MRGITFISFVSGAAALAVNHTSLPLEKCPGYKALNVKESGNTLTADLKLAGRPCNTYGIDIKDLKLEVEYQTDTRLHVAIYDANKEVYQVPESVFPRPEFKSGTALKKAALKFNYKESPFSFSIERKDTKEILFDTAGSELVFQSQYLNLRTSLPEDPNLYGLGEHSDSLHLETTNYTRTLWSHDAYTIPAHTNLYGNHPIYIDHRGKAGTHGVFLLNSNGMDIKINKTDDGAQYLEYNTLGGIFDFYFLAGPTPKDVSAQYSGIVGLPAMQSYWTFGFHQCRYGYRDVFEVAEVVYNYSKADIPLETMWTDIDYMNGRAVFTLDPERFPIEKMQELVNYLHRHQQHYILMVDPAVKYGENDAFNRGHQQDAFLKNADGSLYQGVVWPGATVFPDWFHGNTPSWWNGEFNIFFNPETGVNIDGLWIDMNEASNFCPWPCADPQAYAEENNYPPAPPPARTSNPRPLPGFPSDFQPSDSIKFEKRALTQSRQKLGLSGRDLINPPYHIDNAAGSISNLTIRTDLTHAGGYADYDTHNLYGTMMSSASRNAMQQRRPKVRPLVITRSTFAGAGAHVGHWLGDNVSNWDKYRISIAEQLSFSAIFQIPMVGSDVCGYSGATTEELCARWTTLGAFSPFFRNHNELGNPPQEFYRWASVANAARKVINIRYRLLDYLYTAFHQQTTTGEPFLQPMFYLYPEDPNTFAIDLQFFYGDAILVSPVTSNGSTSVEAYFPDDVFYDWYTEAPLRGHGTNITLTDIDITSIPLHIRGGTIVPVRSSGANTTTELRAKGFDIVIAPGLDGTATGSLYMDDGDSLHQPATLDITLEYRNGIFRMNGGFGYSAGVQIESVKLLGQENEHGSLRTGLVNGIEYRYNAEAKSVTAKIQLDLTKPNEVSFF